MAALNAKYYYSDWESETLKFASDELRADNDVVLAAIREWASALKYASYELQNDKDFILQAIQVNSHIYHYLSELLIKDKDILKFILE